MHLGEEERDGMRNKDVRATVISQTRNGARALAKEWECSFDKSGALALSTHRPLQKLQSTQESASAQRPSCNLELLAIACTSWECQLPKQKAVSACCSDTTVQTPVKRLLVGRALSEQ